MVIDGPVDPRAARAALALMGATLIAFVIVEVASGVWGVHGGQLFPYRHLPVVPLVGQRWLLVEWSAATLVGVGLASGRGVAWFVRLGALVACFSLSQRYSNGRALLCIALVSLALDPPVDGRSHANGLLRAQLLLVYVTSVLHKLTEGFLSAPGIAERVGVGAEWDRPLGIATLVMELAIPLLLSWRPRAGVALAVVMHAAFAAAMPFVAPFSMLSVALACLFVRPRDVATTGA